LGTGGAGAEAVATAPPEPVVEPSETVFMQSVDFLLDAKATSVSERCRVFLWRGKR